MTADIRARSTADPKAIADLLASDEAYPTLVAAGGIIGYSHVGAINCTVTLTEVSATAEYAGSDLYVFAGGVAGFARLSDGNAASGAGEVSASGGTAVYDTIVAHLDEKD